MVDGLRAVLLVAIAAALLAPACAPDDLGGTCRFSGDQSTPCGKCMATSCQKFVDSCCADSTCRDALGSLDTCALGGSCQHLTQLSATLASCASSSCGSVCKVDASSVFGGTDAGTVDAGRRFITSCSAATANTGCICSPSGNSDYDDNECSEVSTAVDGGNGICCAGKGWPEEGTSCSCDPFTCEQVQTSNGLTSVICGEENYHQHQTEGSDSYCCTDLTLKECKCGPENLPCDYGSPVSRCSVAVMDCGSNRTRVRSCSLTAQ